MAASHPRRKKRNTLEKVGLGSSNEQYVKDWIKDADKKLKDASPKDFKTDEKKLNDYLNSGDLL